MTERIIGEPGPKRRRRFVLFPLLALLALALVFGVSRAAAAFVNQVDENGPNDVPGQKDLTSQGFDDSALPTSVQVRWNWDELGTSGANTLDACALLDSDSDGKANFALCGTTSGNPAGSLVVTKYSCGDTRVDRCTSPLAVITSGTSACTLESPSGTDPFGGPGAKNTGAGYPDDVRVTCTIILADFGVAVTDLELINTCSYPSSQPNSDPSDCVLIPRTANLVIVKDAGGDTTPFPFTVSGGGTFSGDVSDGTNQNVGLIAGTATTVTEGTLPTGWAFSSASCTGSTISGGNGTPDNANQKVTGVKAATGGTVTCTFINVVAKGSPGASTAPTLIPQDSATVSGLTVGGADDGAGADQNMTFSLYDDGDTTCTGTALYVKTVAVTADGSYATDNDGTSASPDGYTITADGTYRWQVVYNGDTKNNPFTIDCGDEHVDVTIVNP